MKHLFIPYEIALQLKEKGFDEECLRTWSWYFSPYFEGTEKQEEAILIDNKRKSYETGNELPRKYCYAPLYQQVIDWFREKKSIWIQVEMMYYDGVFYNYTIIQSNGKVIKCAESYYDYYETLENAIKETLNLI